MWGCSVMLVRYFNHRVSELCAITTMKFVHREVDIEAFQIA